MPSAVAYDQVAWAAAEHPTELIDRATLRRPRHHTNLLRVGYFTCNAPGTTRYSVVTNGVKIAAIHAHGQDSDTRFYEDVETAFARSMVWIYMPVDQISVHTWAPRGF